MNPHLQIVIVMGVAGSGKTTIGTRLAKELGAEFRDGDEFHSPENIAKMAAGEPLDEHDRAPWIAAMARAIEDWLAHGARVVLACSALKAAHRKALLRDPDRMRVVYLRAEPSLLRARIAARRGHYFPAKLLDSQLAALEEPGADAIVVDASRAPDAVVADILRALNPGPR